MTTTKIDTTMAIPASAENLQMSGQIMYVNDAGDPVLLGCLNLSAIRALEIYRGWRESAEQLLSRTPQKAVAYLLEYGISEEAARYSVAAIEITRTAITEAVNDSSDASNGEIMEEQLGMLHVALIALLDHLYHKRHGSETFVPSPTDGVDMFEGIVSYQENGYLLAKRICDMADDVYDGLTENQN